MKTNILLSLLFCTSAMLSAQQGTISGNVQDAHGPVPSVSILVSELNMGATTDYDGRFSMQLPAGTYKVTFSHLGYETLELNVTVDEGQLIDLGAITLEYAENKLEQVELTGFYRSGEREAIEKRRNASSIMEVTSADAIGKLPDINAAESIQRIPGVSIDRDQGEGRYVTVRGTPSQWSSTTYNGDRIPAAKTSGALLGNRTVPMDLMPSEFIQSIEVIKAITPEYEGDAIGGTINIVPRTAAEKKTLMVTAGSPFNTRAADKIRYNGNILYGDRFIGDKLGVLLSGNINSRTYGTDSYVVAYGNDMHNVTTLDVRDYQGVRTNTGFNGALDFRVTPNTTLYTRGYYTSLLDNERNRKTMHYFNRAANNAVLRWNIVDYWFKNYGGEVGVESKLSDNLNLKGRVALYESWAGYKGPSSVDKNMRGYYYGNWIQTVQYGNLVNIDGTDYKFLDGDGPEGYQGDAHDNIQPHFVSEYNPDEYYLERYVTSIRNIRDTDRVAALDLKYDASGDLTLKFGGKFRYKSSAYDYRYVTWTYDTDAPKAYLPLWEQEPHPNSNWHPELNNVYDHLKFNYPTENSFIDPMSNPAVAPHLTYHVNDKTNSHYAAGNYDATEIIGAGYAMGEWGISDKSQVVGGVRYEHTSLTSDSFEYNDATGEVTPVSGEQSNPAFLPMVHFIHRPTEKWDLRAAVTRTFARAAFNELSPSTRTNPDNETVTIGNPQLKPPFSWNYDLIGSYYINPLSYLSAGVFYKDIKDVIYVQTYDEMRTVDGNSALYRVSQPLNSEEAFLYGFELGYNQKFTFLPGILNGLGLSANYTYTKSETTLESRDNEKIGLMNQSPNIVNATLFYEKDGFALRLSSNYRDAFLMDVRSNSGADRYQDKDFHLDLNMSYTFNNRMTVFLDVNNLTNQPLRYYHGVSSRPETVEYYSIRGRLGITWNVF